MIVLFFSGLGTLIGAIYHFILHHIFARELTDISLGFRKNPKKVRYPAMLLAVIIFIALAYGLFQAALLAVPLYDKVMTKLFRPAEIEINRLNQIRKGK